MSYCCIPRKKAKAAFIILTLSEKFFLSPASQLKRTAIDKCQRRKRYAPHDIILDDKLNNELFVLVMEIENNGIDKLQAIFLEAEKHGARSTMESTWNLDVQRNKQQFQADQWRNVSPFVATQCDPVSLYIVQLKLLQLHQEPKSKAIIGVQLPSEWVNYMIMHS